MRLLLDAHALFWYTTGDSQLSATAQTIIQDGANDVFISPASFWEMAIKVSVGKWQMNQSFEDYVDACLNRYHFVLLAIEPAHAIAVSRLPFPTSHRDPFDRLLIAQAQVEQLSIVSADAAFDAYSVQRMR